MRLLLLCALGWCFIHFFRYMGSPVPFLNSYLTDFLAVPAMAHGALLFTRRFVARDPGLVYPFTWILFIVVYTSLVMEVAAPAYSSTYTGDWGDVVAYLLGGVCYHLLLKYFAARAHKKRSRQTPAPVDPLVCRRYD